MDFRQLETFVEVAKLKSFSKAAKKLFITQPTVTNHIQNLEKELNTLLLNRFGKKVSLTEEGTLLFKHAIEILNTCDTAKFELASFHDKIQGHLMIYSSSIPRKYLLPSILKEFIQKYPNVTFTLGEKDSHMVVKGITDGETDFGILGATYDIHSINYVKLMEDNLVLITPNTEQFQQENYTVMDVSVIFENNLIFREEGSGTRQLIEETLRANDIELSDLKYIAYVEDTEAIKSLVYNGLGVSLISEKAIEKEVADNKIKAFKIKDMDFSRNFYFAYHKNRQLSPLYETFKDFVISHNKY